MLSTFKYKKLTWVNLESPTSEEVKTVIKKYSVHPLVADELLQPTIRPKVDSYKNFIYLILHFPVFDPIAKTSESREIDFIIGKNFLITSHYKNIPPLYELIKIFEADAILMDTDMAKNTGVLIFYIMRRMYDFSLRQLDHIQLNIGNIEAKIFSSKFGFEYGMVQEISYSGRDTLDFKRIIQSHKEVLESLEREGIKFLGASFSHYANNIIGDYYKVWNMLESHKETIESLKNTHDSMLTHRTNDIMKTLTIMAFITFPLAVFTSLFGMNTKYLPIVGTKGDFWIVVTIMLLSTLVMFKYFKHKKWI